MTARARPSSPRVIASGTSPASGRPVRVGISQCLLGDPVRYDGGHKREPFLADVLGQHMEWVPICPEVEAGFGIPREAMRLVGDAATPRLITIRSQKDQTARMLRYTRQRLRDLQVLHFAGYVFKKDSPSCGMRRVRVYARDGQLLGKGQGLFAAAFQKTFPLIPIEEEERLRDRSIREHFLERVSGYHRWQSHILGARLTRRALVAFHAAHKYLVLAHSRRHYQQLGACVADAGRVPPRQLTQAYGRLFMEALAVKTTRHKHMNVLQHLTGYFKNTLSPMARRDLHNVMHDYHRGLVPLNTPVTLIRHYAQALDIPHLRDQAYLTPYPNIPMW